LLILQIIDMKKVLFALMLVFLFAGCSAQQASKPQAVIFDSDMGPDYDDVGAIAMLHAFADSGYFNILATVSSTRYAGVAGVFNVLNTYFGRPDLPIGVPHQNGLELRDWQHWSDSLLANYPHTIKQNSEVPEATEVYRKILAAQPDNSVTIITVGFFTNLANLLRSGPDKYTQLNGIQLVRKKVKRLVSMAGKFPAGKEFNVEKDASASQQVFAQWPTSIWLSGWEIGAQVKVGVPLINNGAIMSSPVKDAFRIAIPMSKEDAAGRMSWDETAVLVAAKGYAPWYRLQQGTMVVANDGSNTWRTDKGRHYYLVAVAPHSDVQKIIEQLIAHQPIQ
jgi:inosine-uridine nucleoside N-ribohydrolase